MKKWRNKILSAVLVLSLLLTSSSFAFAAEGDGTTEENIVQIPREQLDVVGFSSEQNNTTHTEGPADKAIDGDPNTYWHTIWGGTDPVTGVSANSDTEKFIVIDLGETVFLKEFKMLPRNIAAANVKITACSVFVSTTLDEGTGKPVFGETPYATATFTYPNTTDKKVVTFDESVYTRYVKIQATDKNAYATIAELEFYMDADKMPSITQQPVSQTSNDEVTLNVAATPAREGTLSYQWYSFTDANTEPAAVENSNNASITVTPAEDGSSTYYYAIVSETFNDITVSIRSNTAYVVKSSGEIQITKLMGLSVTASSSYTGNDVSYVIDGDKTANSDAGSTKFWETRYGNDDPDKWIQFDLGDSYYLSKLTYYPRKHTYMNGSVAQYKLYGSNDGDTWFVISQRDETDEWVWEANVAGQSKDITFDVPVNVRYVKMVPTMMWGNIGSSMQHSDYTMAAAEIELFADTTADDIVITQPTGGIYTDSSLTVTAKEGSTYQWYSNTENSYVGATELNSGTEASYTAETSELNKYYFVKVTNSGKSVYSDIVYVSSGEAKIDRNGSSVYYETFAGAMDAVQDGETVTVLSDVVLTSSTGFEITDKNITIKSEDNQNFTIKRGSGLSGFLFKTSGTANVTFENITIDGGKNDSITARGAIIDVSGGTLTLGEGTVLQNNKTTSNGGALNIAGGTTNVNGAEIKNNEAANGGALYMKENCDVFVNINSGIITENIATSNGGAIAIMGINNPSYIHFGSESGQLTIAGNTSSASKGNGIYLYNNNGNFGKRRSVSFDYEFNMEDDIFYGVNGGGIIVLKETWASAKPINIVVDNGRGSEDLFIVENDSEGLKEKAFGTFKVFKNGTQKEVSFAYNNRDNDTGSLPYITYINTAVMSISKNLNNGDIYYKGIENNIYNVSGATNYSWYIQNENGSFEKTDIDVLASGTYTAYCVADNGTNYMMSNIAEITVKDFVPCSKAIDKFKNL